MRTAFLAGSLVAALAARAFAGPSIEAHELTVRLVPADSVLEAEDRVTIRRDGGGVLEFTLGRPGTAVLAVTSAMLDGRELAHFDDSHVPGADGARVYRLELPEGPRERSELVLRYAGAVRDAVDRREGSFVVGDSTTGLIVPEGAYLSDATGWYPSDGGLAKFTVHTHPVPGWEVVTQGTRTAPAAEGAPTTWTGKFPVDGLSLVAGPWKVFRKKAGNVEIGAYLTEQNAAGADVLLDHAAQYLAKYGELLGPYAYDRFDVVENFFTTGYGMPEFTLLGGNVIARMLAEQQRKGAIPPGYLDHEIVHCWWGNLVYPDYATGNWCEALTTYCSNYRTKEEAGADAAAEHRRQTALRFTLRVNPQNEYPVRAFRGKAEAADDDIGYGKGSMFFHALRREIGEDAFWGTLRRVSAERRGQRISWDDWRAHFEASAKRDLRPFFTQGLDRTGAPLLELRDAELRSDGGRMRVVGVVRQALADGEEPWRVAVPIVVEHLGGIEERVLDLVAAETQFSIGVPSMPLRVSVDPAHHVFRRIGPEEVPACLAATLERPRVVVVHPDGDEGLAGIARVAARSPNVRVVSASAAPQELERGTSYLILGDASRVPLLASLREKLPRHFPPASSKPETTMVVASSRSPADGQEFVTTVVGAPGALAARARFVFYYQFDGRVLFDGPIPKDRSLGATPSRTTRLLLPDLRAATSAERARTVVDALAAPAMKGRRAGSPEEAAARKLVMDELRMAGVEPREEPFAFSVKHVDPLACELEIVPGTIVPGMVPLVASPETAAGGIRIVGAAEADDADVAGRAVVVDIGAGVEKPLAFLRDVARVAAQRGAAAVFVRVPDPAPAALADLWQFPGILHPEVAKRLQDAKARGGDADPVRHAAATAARLGSDDEFPLPIVAVSAQFVPEKDRLLRLVVRFRREEIRSANVVATLRAKRDGAAPAQPAATVVLGAHVDHLGEGFAGADDNASGVAALLEAVNVLTTHGDLLSRDVTVAFFGAEEWGLRGSRAFLDRTPKDTRIAAMVNADTVGRRGVEGVSVVGITHHPNLGRAVAAAVERSGLAAGSEIDRFAFAWGSDHWSFHERGIPAVDLWAGDYRVMHTTADTADGVDAEKVAKVGRALALSAIAAAASAW